ncbi:MAG: PadR family transcriptional regulator [Firmicutes bacterium]|nr:PadR family transcriptional regulator [Bacillota bacterium]
MENHSCHSQLPHGCRYSGSRIERFIEPCLLLLLREKPAHGYDLMERLRDFGFDGENQDPGMVYRNLRRLEEDGMVRSEWDTTGSGPARRLYEVTPEGKELLQAWVEVIRQNIVTLKSFLERYDALDTK